MGAKTASSGPMAFRILKLEPSTDLLEFIQLPWVLHSRPNYVPPFWSDEQDFHDPRRNPALDSCGVVRFMAYDGKRPVGRIMGIIHHAYNKRHEERTARFYQLDCAQDDRVAANLLAAVEEWARAHGMDRVIGPFGLSDKDPQGLQVEGFEHLPVIATATNPDWLPTMVEGCGYGKLIDAVVYRVDIPVETPELHARIAGRVMRSSRFRLLRFTSKRELTPWIVPVLRLVNQTYTELLGFEPMTEAEMTKLANQYLPVLDPAFVQVIVDEQDDPVAFVVAMPDMSIGVQRAGGRLFPFGWWHILRAMKRSKQLDLFLGAVRPDLQGLGLTCVLGIALMEAARKRGLTHMDSHLVLETNSRMRAELERLGGQVWKRYRVYQKAL